MEADDAATRGPRRRALGLALRALGLVLVAVVAAEAVLQVAALFASDRAGTDERLAARRIVALGDSHTFGAGVAPHEGYPVQLQQILDERSPDSFSVINVGVPGMNSAQALNRLPAHVSRFQPEAVILWVGCNNAWNWAEQDSGPRGVRAWLEGFALRSRLYRLIRVRAHDRMIDELAEESAERDNERQLAPTGAEIPEHYRQGIGGRRERLAQDKREFAADEAMERRTEADFRAMAEYARAAGIELILVEYPGHFGAFVPANSAMRRVAEEFDLTIIDSRSAARRVPKPQRKFIWAYHPTGPIYHEIAADLADALLEKTPPLEPATKQES